MRNKIKIIYKSGHVETFRVKEFSISERNGELTKVTWLNPSKGILFVGINEIAAVYDLGKVWF